MRNLIARYWGLVTQVDLSVGAVLRTLDQLDLAENTIVVYTTDHGDMMGSRHMVEKSVMYEEAVRVPCLMRIPQMNGKNRIIKNRVSHIDMVPTLIELLHKSHYDHLPGRSLVPLIKGQEGDRDHIYIQWNPNSGALRVKGGGTTLAPKEELKRVKNEHTRAVISPDGWKLCLSDADKSQLFNLNKDPGETTNLYGSAWHAEITKELIRSIHRWQESIMDEVRV
jgi:arylsulfatase A-like enzyme